MMKSITAPLRPGRGPDGAPVPVGRRVALRTGVFLPVDGATTLPLA
jgi:hypothetical protein